jgi:hypothetical protein
MQKMLGAGTLLVLVMGGGASKAIALKIIQPEGTTGITACVRCLTKQQLTTRQCWLPIVETGLAPIGIGAQM